MGARKRREAYLSYTEDDLSVNWSAELEALHQEASRTHFIGRWTRSAIVGRVGSLPPGATIVDVGCSSGYSLRTCALPTLAVTVFGIDLIATGLVKAHPMGANPGQRQRRRLRSEPTYRLVRYCDDFVIVVAGERRHAEALIAQTEEALAPLGLTLSREKTCIAHIDEGIEFLGWKIKRQPGRDGRPQIYTYPSKRSLQAAMGKVKQITRTGPNHC